MLFSTARPTPSLLTRVRRRTGDELRAVPAVSRGDDQGQHLLALLAGQVRLGGQPAPGVTQCVVGWLVMHSARRFVLQVCSVSLQVSRKLMPLLVSTERRPAFIALLRFSA